MWGFWARVCQCHDLCGAGIVQGICRRRCPDDYRGTPSTSSSRRFRRGQFVHAFGLVFGFADIDWDKSAERALRPVVVAPVAPTTEAYQAETREVMTPFLQQAEKISAENFGGVPSMLSLATQDQERLLDPRAKGFSRRALGLRSFAQDRWKRMGGSKIDKAAVLKKTPELVGQNPSVLRR